ncbi:hypothetical protein E2C01_073195 [Portunus trituberculatus]|uniref:Uncharacterized protein n=1 Tax=Portunus trituberculatus TaxID=210409 RepID=A0A5B7I052_PORTR|nr:hypothetical protein [Portunus trituberculatus]
MITSLRAGSSSHRKSSQPGLLLLLSIPSPATAVTSLPHSSFWTSPAGLLLSGSSLVTPSPCTRQQWFDCLLLSLSVNTLILFCLVFLSKGLV